MEKENSRPTSAQLRAELERVSRRRSGSMPGRILLIVFVLLILAAVLAAVLLPSYAIYGESMAPALSEGDLVLGLPGAGEIVTGTIVALQSGDRVLIKRVIGCPGDEINILEDGSVERNGIILAEPYLKFTGPGAADMDFPCTVPDGSFFVLGDNRPASVDSRNGIVGFVSQDDIISRIVFRFWPLNRVSFLSEG
ncbi:MAG: signal peptidase I [Oscillospiraceae bacterium]|nr:signal peptidase I [Oscillospiraceae bacterium]